MNECTLTSGKLNGSQSLRHWMRSVNRSFNPHNHYNDKNVLIQSLGDLFYSSHTFSPMTLLGQQKMNYLVVHGNGSSWNQGLGLCHMLNVRTYAMTSKVTPSLAFKNEKFLLTQPFSVLFKWTRDYRDQSMYWHQWHKISQLTLVRAKQERQTWRGCQIYCKQPAYTAEQKRSEGLGLYLWMISIKRGKIYDICVRSQWYGNHINWSS